jgi:hypothetical protein
MPGGFTWADAFQGFSDAVLLGNSIGAWIVTIVVVALILFGIGAALGTAIDRMGRTPPVDTASVSVAYDYEPPFTGRADWPKRKAS